MKELSGSRLLVIALVCGVLAAVLTVFYLKQVENKYKQANKPKEMVEVAVVVPRTNLARGAVISKQTAASRRVPQAFLPSGVILSSDFKNVMNRTLKMPVERGKPLTWAAVTGKAAKNFSGNVELGRRALSIKVSKIDSFDGLLRPGDRIDLLGQFTSSDLGLVESGDADFSDEIVMPVLENVEVLSAGREDLNGRRYEKSRPKNSADGFNMEFSLITLNLSPKQIARAQLAEQTGSMFAVLRHPKDTSLIQFDYLGVDLLLQKDEPEAIDVVLDENGNPIGRIVGDNIVDADGNIVGKIVNGKPVSFDGKPLGQVVKNIDPSDPIFQVAETADVVRDANGNIIGKIVDGKILDADGNVVGRIDKDGNPIGLDGESLGKIDRGVALDASGNEVNMAGSSAEMSKTRRQQVVRDANGNIIGRVVNGEVVDENGNVIGKLDENGKPISLSGKSLGVVEEALVDRSGNLVASEAQVVRDADGNIIGRVVNGQVIDASGNVVGSVDADGNPIGLNGESLGSVETVMLNDKGEAVGEVSTVVRDENGNIIGRVVNGKVVDADGNVIGMVDKDGTPLGADGKVLGVVEKVVTDASGRALEEGVEVVRDADGNIIGRLVDGKVIDADGNVIGELKGGQLVDADGNVIQDGLSVSAEDAVTLAAEQRSVAQASITSSVKVIDFIAGGSAKDGIVPVQKIRLE